MASLPILLPPLAEQGAIAAVLDSIDAAIERTDDVIAATQRLRDALLHELLTHGVPGRHSAWHYDPALGTIPASWEVVRLGDAVTLQRGFDLPVRDRTLGSVPIFGSNGVVGYHETHGVQEPGVITGRSGSIGLVHYSLIPFWPLNTTLYVSDFHCNDERFVFYLLSALRLERFAASTGTPSLNRNFVHPLIIALPPLEEQQAIASMLDAVGEAVERAREERSELQALKASASDALLTGRVRIGAGGAL